MRTGLVARICRLFTFPTLKRRIVFLLSAGIMGCCILTAIVSYNAIYTMQQNRIRTSMAYDLDQQSAKLTNTYNNLLQITQQLSPEGNVGYLVDEYFYVTEPYQRSVLSRNISSIIGLITFSNPSVQLIMYYRPTDGRIMFNDFPPRDGFSPLGLKDLLQSVDITYQTPHLSQCRFSRDQVVSVTRRVTFSNGEQWLIYVEAKCDIAPTMDTDSNAEPYTMMLLDQEGFIKYRSDPSAFSGQQQLLLTGVSGKAGGYIWNKSQSTYGYALMLMVPTLSYNSELYTWTNQMFVIVAFALVMMMVTGLMLWQLTYKPLQVFETEMEALGRGHMDTLQYNTGIVEFDRLFQQFNEIKQQIQQLIVDVELKEKRRHQLEIEKLAYQINPHFLMNALNSVHWLAVMHGQKEIDKFISTLNYLLSYNLGKTQECATLQTEIDVIRAYLDLQQMRYDFEVELDVEEGDYLHTPIVRFILQPIVENAVCHGIDEHGTLRISVSPDKQSRIIRICITDDGRGFDAEALEVLQQSSEKEVQGRGRGIGLRYVKSMLETFYGDRARMYIESEPRCGTSVLIELPYEGGEDNDSSTHCG